MYFLSRLCKTCSNSFTFHSFDDIISTYVNSIEQEVRILSDKRYNNNNDPRKNHDDIDAFFAEFDNPAITGKPADPSDTVHASRSSSARTGAQRRSSSAKSQNSRSDSSRTSSAKSAADKKAEKLMASMPDGKGKRGNRSGKGGNRSNKPPTTKKNILRIAFYAALGFVLAVGIYVGIVFTMAPKVETDDLYSMLAQRSILYDCDGNEVENLYFSDGNRTIVEYKDIPEDLVNAVVAVEDRKFWKHNGFNFIRMAGAIVDSVTGGGQISGTSTVTQQLARNVYLAEIKSQRSLSRKLSEMYCTIVLEKNLSKKEIMEAYLNTIYLGFNSYGAQAAAQTYYSKNVSELDLLECASFAALPQAPDNYAIVKVDYSGSSESSLPVIATSGSTTYLYNGDITKDRRNMILSSMKSLGFVSEEEYTAAVEDDLKDHVDIGAAAEDGLSSYFTDYAVSELTDDIVSEYGYTRAEAQDLIYTGGLKIYTTMDSDIQKIVEKEFAKDSNFTGISYLRTDSKGNLLNTDGSLLLYKYDNYFNDDDEFTLSSDEYKKNSDGSITIYKGKRLNLYQTEVNGEPDVSVEFKGMYTRDDGSFYFIESGALSIPQGYKTVDDDGNCIVSAQFFTDYPEFFSEDDGDLVVSSDNYSLKQKVRQPQAAMVIIENSTGELKAMMGGRGTTGKQLFNRATSTRQPGSSIKPIGVYGPALQMSYEYEKDGKTMRLDKSDGSDWGKYITAGSIINDEAMRYGGRTWPKNWYSGYRGQTTLRTAVQQSINVSAVKTYQQIGPDYAASMLEKNGITSIDQEGEVNDLNPAALALGGMSSGISPLELAASYETFVNGGVYKEPISYTKVLDSKGEVLFENVAETKQVYNEGVAWIMTDILRTVVSQGIAGNASIGVQPVGGKTGTTDDNFDTWFCGFTPQYTASLWMGTDVNIKLSAGSSRAASFWSRIMRQVCEDLPRGSFPSKPSNVVSVGGEYYTEGTYSRVTMKPSTTEEQTTEAPTTEATTQTTTQQQTTQPTTQKPSTQPTTQKPSSQSTTAKPSEEANGISNYDEDDE